MIIKISMLLSILVTSECYVYSSFWAPLFNPRILNYKVDSTFDPNSGPNARDLYVKSYGYRGENLIADLGNGKGPSGGLSDGKMFGDVKFYYTYPRSNGADPYELQ